MNNKPLPLSLYIHIPWCVRKCPYCDFNSHRAGAVIPEQRYIDLLLTDLMWDLPAVAGRTIETIFIGGGTPSLLSAVAVERLLSSIADRVHLAEGCEITMEANPGTMEAGKFRDFKQAGVNRLSIGVQSFSDDKLKQLGRIHDAAAARAAIEQTVAAGFNSFNLDLMHGLPEQAVEEALVDLTTALAFAPSHLSWYQLTIEPRTVFAKHPPALPGEEHLWQIEQQGLALLAAAGYQRYEISAYSQPGYACRHNINYWQFGDYLGIGAGAHSKLTDCNRGTIVRAAKIAHPTSYLNAMEKDSKHHPFMASQHQVETSALPLEFMMNALRLTAGVPLNYFSERTGLVWQCIDTAINQALENSWLTISDGQLATTALGQQFLNNCLQLFG
ncbi:MAG: radical SAM family heme chaperone HemW [Gammaproteobacteria bacterium]|nr:radical SAM family heme chaperone HemW [Gammaproteobacteria bacterium]